MTQTAAESIASPAEVSDRHRDLHGYEVLRDLLAARIAGIGGLDLFVTNATGLFDAFLAALPAEERQGYTCNCCRRFFDAYGGLVTIVADGTQIPLLWNSDGVPPFFARAVEDLGRLVRRAKVVGVHVSSDATWGTPSNRARDGHTWSHFHGRPPAAILHHSKLLTANQRAAELREEHGTLARGLALYAVDYVRQAVGLLESETLYRSEKVIGPARFLLTLHEALAGVRNERTRANLIWRAAASAPAGFAHPKTTMVGTLLDDLSEGKSFEEAKRAFDAKMNPILYQRPQAPPSAGNIAAAEVVVAKLQSTGALRRRFARLDEVVALWRPPEPTRAKALKVEKASAVFGHLLADGDEAKIAPMSGGTATVTFAKFQAKVLPTAERIDFYVPAGPSGFCALVTASDPEAPPILQWDRENQRNPVSWYFYHGGSAPQNWGLTSNTWARVTAVCRKPSAWHGGNEHHGDGAIFILEGAADKRQPGLCLFPEILRSEYHAVRSTIEAHSRAGCIEGADQATACGIGLSKGDGAGLRFRVLSRGIETTYTIDRLD